MLPAVTDRPLLREQATGASSAPEAQTTVPKASGIRVQLLLFREEDGRDLTMWNLSNIIDARF